MFTVLIFGDIVARIGREAVRRALPELKEKYKPDLTLGNVENLAHGKGASERTIEEMRAAGIDFFTSGNHIFAKKDFMPFLARHDAPVLRPLNYSPRAPGCGKKVLEIGAKRVGVINLLGRVFMRDLVDDPFAAFDAAIEDPDFAKAHAVIVDFHGETTSEKAAFGWHADGRASLVIGTHTHVPTSDARIFPKGTGFITDVGMTGGRDTVIGVDKDVIVNAFRTGLPGLHSWPEEGWAVVNAVVAQIDTKTKKTVQLEHIHQEIEI